MSKANFQTKSARHRASGVCVAQGRILLVSLRDPRSGNVRLFPPGGLIEDGEPPEETAVRETFEETGFRVLPSLIKPLVIRYDFDWNGVLFDCTTHFVSCRLLEGFREPLPVKDTDYNLGAVWLPLSEVSDALSFHQPIRQAVLDLIDLT